VYLRALLDFHLRLGDRAAARDGAGVPAKEMRDLDAVLETFPAHADEIGEWALEPGRRHPAVVMPDRGEIVPGASVPEDRPVLDDPPHLGTCRDIELFRIFFTHTDNIIGRQANCPLRLSLRESPEPAPWRSPSAGRIGPK
jgi:hypothetical protein